jgi:drug/metabolite transporter (DMT)-like permease
VPSVNRPRALAFGPWLVALGAAMWGTESAWRVPLLDRFDEDVMVWWEHVALVALALPLILPRLGELRRASRATLGWLVFSGVAGSAVGTVLFSMALDHGNPTVANVVLNVQPVVSTAAAFLIFRDRLAPTFFAWAALAVGAGMTFALAPGEGFSLDGSVPYALGCALFWGLSTVAGRGVMIELSLPLASGMRVVVGLVAMTVVVAVRGHFDALWPAKAAAEPAKMLALYALLVTVSGGIPLLVYFAGLARTRASTAGYFEMMQTLAGAAVTWLAFDHGLASYQVIAGVVLVGAVAMVQRAQASVGS